MKKVTLVSLFVLILIFFILGIFSFSIVQALSCGDNISESTILSSDLGNCTGFALNINASNVVLDCAGYTISVNETEYWDGGIYVYNVNNVIIKNCIINGFSTYSSGAGINLTGGNNHSIIYNRFYGLSQVVITSSSNVLGSLNISDNYVNSSGNYAFILNIENSTIDNNTILNAHNTALYLNGTNNIISRNFINATITESGIWLLNSFSGIFDNNTVSSSGVYGINIPSGTNNSINFTNNSIYDNNRSAIYVASGVDMSNKLIWHNNFYNNDNGIGGGGYQITTGTTDDYNLSFNGQGNYWGRNSCPLFIAGTDVDRNEFVDSYPYDDSFAWLIDSSPPSCDLTAPEIVLVSPENDNITYSSTVTFVCSANDSETALKNVTLYGNFSGSLENNETNSSPVNGSETTFTIGILDGYYIWFCRACDNISNCDMSSGHGIYVSANAPVYSSNLTNSTYAGEAVLHSLYWQDNNTLSSYIFSFDNGNGTFTNETWQNFTGLTNWSNVTKLVHSTVGSTIQWMVYANDSFGNLNVSLNYSYVTTDGINPVASQGTNPVDYYNDSDNSITFDMKCYDNVAVSWIQLWTNTTGTWHANYTNSSYTNNTWINLTFTGIPDGSNYKWAVWCNDTSGNTNITDNRTFNVTDGTAPTVTLNLPTSNDYLNSTNVTFNCSATDSTELANINLYGNWSGGWHLNDTVNKNGTSNSTLLYKTLTTNASYRYNCYVCDILGNCGFAADNKTFTVDTREPTVSLSTLDDAEYSLSSGGTKTVIFHFDVDDNDGLGIDECYLYIEDDITVNEDDITVNEDETLSYVFDDDGSYDWKVGCVDYAGNDHNSSERTVVINPYSSSSSGSTDTSDDDEETTDTNKTINAGNLTAVNSINTISGLSMWDKIQFDYEGIVHTITMKNVTTTSATIEVNSTPVTFTLNIGQIKELDLNENGKNDFSITLRSITNQEAKLLLKSIEETNITLVSEENSTGNLTSTSSKIDIKIAPEAWKWISLALIVIIVAFLVATILFLEKRKKRLGRGAKSGKSGKPSTTKKKYVFK